MTSHSHGSNCINDNCTEGLDNLRSFLTGASVAGIRSLETSIAWATIPANLIKKQKKVTRCTVVYMSGYIAKLLLKLSKNCRTNVLFRSSPLDDDFIQARQYNKAQLQKPGNFLIFLTSHSYFKSFRAGIERKPLFFTNEL